MKFDVAILLLYFFNIRQSINSSKTLDIIEPILFNSKLSKNNLHLLLGKKKNMRKKILYSRNRLRKNPVFIYLYLIVKYY